MQAAFVALDDDFVRGALPDNRGQVCRLVASELARHQWDLSGSAPTWPLLGRVP